MLRVGPHSGPPLVQYQLVYITMSQRNLDPAVVQYYFRCFCKGNPNGFREKLSCTDPCYYALVYMKWENFAWCCCRELVSSVLQMMFLPSGEKKYQAYMWYCPSAATFLFLTNSTKHSHLLPNFCKTESEWTENHDRMTGWWPQIVLSSSAHSSFSTGLIPLLQIFVCIQTDRFPV